MQNIYKKLTMDQRQRGVIFSSTLSNSRNEQEENFIHEVYNTTSKKELVIKRLKDAGFFEEIYKYNIIRK